MLYRCRGGRLCPPADGISPLCGVHVNILAGLPGTSQTMYARYERGANELPVRHLIKLAEYYHVSTDYLLGRSNDPTKSGGPL